VRKADNLPPSCAVVTKSGSLNFQEPSGPVQACNGTALPLFMYVRTYVLCMYVCMYVCTYVRMYYVCITFMHVCMYIYIYVGRLVQSV